MRNLLCIFIVLLCTITFTGQSADTEPSLRDNPFKRYTALQPAPEKQKPKFRVEVVVDCDDENTKAFIESHIKRELRSLQDVEIVAIGKHRISILAVEPIYKASGQKTGEIALGFLLQRFDWKHILDKSFAKYKDTENHDIARDAIASVALNLLTTAAIEKQKFGMTTGNIKTLDSMCQDIVVSFDTQMLEPDRKN